MKNYLLAGKKYLIAGGIAVVAFAMAAFAATLIVDGGVIQAGADDNLTCVTEANVDSYRIDKGMSVGVRFEQDTFENCATGTEVFVYAYDEAGNLAARTGGYDTADEDANVGLQAKWENNFQTASNGFLDPALIDKIEVVVEG